MRLIKVSFSFSFSFRHCKLSLIIVVTVVKIKPQLIVVTKLLIWFLIPYQQVITHFQPKVIWKKDEDLLYWRRWTQNETRGWRKEKRPNTSTFFMCIYLAHTNIIIWMCEINAHTGSLTGLIYNTSKPNILFFLVLYFIWTMMHTHTSRKHASHLNIWPSYYLLLSPSPAAVQGARCVLWRSCSLKRWRA